MWFCCLGYSLSVRWFGDEWIVRNPSMSLSLILARNKKIEYYVKDKDS